MSIKSGLIYTGITALGIATLEAADFALFYSDRMDLFFGGQVVCLATLFAGGISAKKEFFKPYQSKGNLVAQNPSQLQKRQSSSSLDEEIIEIEDEFGRVIRYERRCFKENN